MRFLHPEVLYAFFALLIPILVHLFQLRKFQTEQFTNVVLLKKLEISSRKSSQLKKWLTLLIRLLTISCLILAFAQPYFPTKIDNTQDKQVSIFLDNSYSMSLKGEKGELLKEAKEDLIEHLPENQIFNLITQQEVYKSLTKKELETIIFEQDYSPTSLDQNSIILKSNNTFNSEQNIEKSIVILSDFQDFNSKIKATDSSNVEISFIKYKPIDTFNFQVDTLYYENLSENPQLKFSVSCSSPTTQNVPVSIYNSDELLGKFSLSFKDQTQKTYSFNIDRANIEHGIIEIEDSSLSYDNTLYFSIEKPDPVKVLVISEKYSEYMDRIFGSSRFEYKQISIANLEYSELYDYDQIIINELEIIPEPLRLSLENVLDTNTSVGIIPKSEADLVSYNSLFKTLGLTAYNTRNDQNIKLTTINFDHPYYKNVFTDEVENFDYPSFNSYFESFSTNSMLSFSNGASFLEVNNKCFRFNAPIENNSNFINSPLIVLSLYSLAIQNQKAKDVFYTIGEEDSILIKTLLNSDEVLKMHQKGQSYIPRQQVMGEDVKMFLSDVIPAPGHYEIRNTKGDTLKTVAFNIDRLESNLRYSEFDLPTYIKEYDTFKEFTNYFESNYKIKSFWKWFIGFALMFMIIELFLLRLIK